jgi:glycosyltransferase involved in cell wall biosynthesis
MLSAVLQFNGTGQEAVRAFALEAYRKKTSKAPVISLPDVEVLFESDRLGDADVTVVVPVLKCVQHVEQALESVRAQTLDVLDLIVVEDAASSTSPSIAIEWARHHTGRFNRLIMLRNRENAGVGPTWDAAIDAAESPWVLPLHAEYRLLPRCCAACLATIGDTGASFAYIQVQEPGRTSMSRRNRSFDLFVGENRGDIMPLLSKEAWAAVSGYGNAPRKGEVGVFVAG